MADLFSTLLQVGGVPAVLKLLLQEGFIDGSCLTVTGTPSTALHPLLPVSPSTGSVLAMQELPLQGFGAVLHILPR